MNSSEDTKLKIVPLIELCRKIKDELENVLSVVVIVGSYHDGGGVIETGEDEFVLIVRVYLGPVYSYDKFITINVKDEDVGVRDLFDEVKKKLENQK